MDTTTYAPPTAAALYEATKPVRDALAIEIRDAEDSDNPQTAHELRRHSYALATQLEKLADLLRAADRALPTS